MADQLSLRGGTTTEHAVFTGANKEVTVDTTKKTLVVNDGATVGGHPLMRENASNSALALGSAATPSLKFTGDTNTGIYSPGADQVAISTGGTGRLFVDASGNVNIDSNTLYVDASNNRIGIGTGTPAVSLDVSNATGAYLRTGGSTVALELGPQAGSNGPAIEYNVDGTTWIRGRSDAFPLGFKTNNLERLRIDSSGRLLVGTSTSTSVAGSAALVQIFGNNPVPHSLQLTRGDAPILAFGKTDVGGGETLGVITFAGNDGSDVNSVGALILGQIDGTIGVDDMPGRLVFSTTADGAASPTERMRINNAGRVLVGTSTANASGAKLQTSDGLTFPATAVASADPNTLDDYEEGSWTPIITDGTNDATAGANNYGRYTKIGNRVLIHCFLETSSLGSVTGTLSVKGFPFPSANLEGPGGNVAYFADRLNIAAGQSIALGINKNLATGGLVIWDTAAGCTNLLASEWSSDGYAVVSFQYMTN